MNSFFREVIAKLIQAEFEGHTSFSVADNTAVGDNPIRVLKLDAVPAGDNVLISLSWDGGEKIFEKQLSSEEAQHQFDLISTDLAEAVSLTQKGEYDAAKKVMAQLTQKYAENTGEIVETNLPTLNHTQASKEKVCPTCKGKEHEYRGGCPDCGAFSGPSKDYTETRESSRDTNIWKEAKITMQNLFFSTADELMEYQTKMKELQPKNDADKVPLWDKVNGEKPAGEGEANPDMLAPGNISYEDAEKQKEKEHKNIDKQIKEQVKTEVESAMIEKAATVFGPDQVELVKVLKKNGRNWDEIKKILTKDFNFDKDATTIFVDEQRQAAEGIAPEEDKEKEEEELNPMAPPKDLVPDSAHDELLKDIEDKKEEVKPEAPAKEKGLSPKDIMDIPEEKESAKKCPNCGEDIWDASTVDQRLNKCWNCGTRFDNLEMEEIARADNSDIRKVADLKVTARGPFFQDLKEETQQRIMEELAAYFGGNIPQEEISEAIDDFINRHNDGDSLSAILEGRVRELEASQKKIALNPLQVPPTPPTEQPEVPAEDAIPMEPAQDAHPTPQKGDRVFVSSDLGDEKAGFEGKFVSDYTSKGTKFSIVETDDGELLDVESHRLSTVSPTEKMPEPAVAPEIESAAQEPEIAITPKQNDLYSSLDEIKSEIIKIEAQIKQAESEEEWCKNCEHYRSQHNEEDAGVGSCDMSNCDCKSYKKASLKEAELPAEHICTQCKGPMGYQGFLGDVCDKCVKKNHKSVTGTEKQADPTPVEAPKPPATTLKDVKITPDKIDKEKAIPASPDQAQVIAKLQSIEANLAQLDMAKEQVKARLTAELKKIDDQGERAALEAEYKGQIEKLGVLIEAVDSKLIKYNGIFLAFKQEEKTIEVKPNYKDLMERVYQKFEGVEKYVQQVMNGMQSLAKDVTTRTLTRWPEKRSELGKEASIGEDLAQMNTEMMEALKLLSEPIA